MQFQVPQFIETEDKVVGPFSLRQFLFVGVGAFISFILYFFVSTWLFVIGFIIIMSAAVAIAFVKVNGQPFIKILQAAGNYYWKPQAYVWKPEAGVDENSTKASAPGRARTKTGAEDAMTGGSPAGFGMTGGAASIGSSASRKPAEPQGINLEAIAAGIALHKSWETVQTGSPAPDKAKKTSDREFIEKRMNDRYQIFQKVTGDRQAARRIDYR